MLQLEEQAVVSRGGPIVGLNDRAVVTALGRIDQAQRPAGLLILCGGTGGGRRHVDVIVSVNMVRAVADVSGRGQPVFGDLAGVADFPLHPISSVRSRRAPSV